MDTIKHDQLKLLANENGVKAVTLSGTAGGFLLQVTTNSGSDVLLHTKQEKPRLFKRADAILSYIKDELGIGRATVKIDRWDPSQQAIG